MNRIKRTSRTTLVCGGISIQEIERLRKELSSATSSRMKIELDSKPSSTVPTTAFEEASLALKEAQQHLNETKKENDSILSELKLKLAKITEIEAYLRSLSSCDATIELEMQVLMRPSSFSLVSKYIYIPKKEIAINK